MAPKKSNVNQDDDAEEVMNFKGKKSKAVVVVDDDDEDEEEDDSELDEFEDDDFLVSDDEGEEGPSENRKQKKKNKKRSLQSLSLDAEDLELIKENASSGINYTKTGKGEFKRLRKTESNTEVAEIGPSNDDGLLFDDVEEDTRIFGNQEDDMADFIVDNEEIFNRKPSIREKSPTIKKLKQVDGETSYAQGGHGFVYGDADELLKHHRQGQAKRVRWLESGEFGPLSFHDEYMENEDDLSKETDVPERIQLFLKRNGPPPVDKRSIEEEATWICSQLPAYISPLYSKEVSEGTEEARDLLQKIKKDDILRFLEMHHVEKYDIPFMAMYRKEQCLSLLKDLENDNSEDRELDCTELKPRLKFHQMIPGGERGEGLENHMAAQPSTATSCDFTEFRIVQPYRIHCSKVVRPSAQPWLERGYAWAGLKAF